MLSLESFQLIIDPNNKSFEVFLAKDLESIIFPALKDTIFVLDVFKYIFYRYHLLLKFCSTSRFSKVILVVSLLYHRLEKEDWSFRITNIVSGLQRFAS